MILTTQAREGLLGEKTSAGEYELGGTVLVGTFGGKPLQMQVK
jgi:hypothetical protein